MTYLLSEKLDTLTAIPKILAYDFWTKITLPILWTFSVARFSALKANNPKTKVGYFFGSFFIITRKAYEMVGTHKSVREEIVEDAELGRRVKEQGFSLRVVHGEKYIKAIWARDHIYFMAWTTKTLDSVIQKGENKSIYNDYSNVCSTLTSFNYIAILNYNCHRWKRCHQKFNHIISDNYVYSIINNK